MGLGHPMQTGEELIATAGAVAAGLARVMDIEEMTDFSELIGLVRHNLDIIRFRRILARKKD